MVARFNQFPEPHWPRFNRKESGGYVLVLVVGWLLFACTPAVTPTSDAPQLVSVETLPPASVTPLRLPSASPTATRTPRATRQAGVPRATDVLITVTPPDSPTPTITETPTRTLAPTLTRTPTPSRTPIPTRTFTPSPTFTPFTDPATPFGGGTACENIWFFIPTPPNCPQTPPVSSLAAYQAFEGGIMLRLEVTKTIFILFNSSDWIFAIDTYIEGEFTQDANFFPPAGLFQPQRNFGKVWRNNASIQQQIGWALAPESSYTAFTQTDAVTGIQYISGPNGEIFSLGAQTWQRR